MDTFLNTSFWVVVVILAWFGIIRNVISIIIGHSQDGKLKQGQKPCHLTSSLIYLGALIWAVKSRIWYPLLIGVVLEYVFRTSVRKSGEMIKK